MIFLFINEVLLVDLELFSSEMQDSTEWKQDAAFLTDSEEH